MGPPPWTPQTPPLLNVRGVRVLWGGKETLPPLTFEFSRGVLLVFGPNGSGKTTLLRVLAGALLPTEGEVLVGGFDLSRERVRSRTLLSFLGEEDGLFLSLSPQRNLEYVARLRGTPLGEIPEALEEVGLPKELWRYPTRALSGGMRRRVALARALVGHPPLLLLDEPFLRMDEEGRRRVGTIVEERGRVGCVVITHPGEDPPLRPTRKLELPSGRVESP